MNVVFKFKPSSFEGAPTCVGLSAPLPGSEEARGCTRTLVTRSLVGLGEGGVPCAGLAQAAAGVVGFCSLLPPPQQERGKGLLSLLWLQEPRCEQHASAPWDVGTSALEEYVFNCVLRPSRCQMSNLWITQPWPLPAGKLCTSLTLSLGSECAEAKAGSVAASVSPACFPLRVHVVHTSQRTTGSGTPTSAVSWETPPSWARSLLGPSALSRPHSLLSVTRL